MGRYFSNCSKSQSQLTKKAIFQHHEKLIYNFPILSKYRKFHSPRFQPEVFEFLDDSLLYSNLQLAILISHFWRSKGYSFRFIGHARVKEILKIGEIRSIQANYFYLTILTMDVHWKYTQIRVESEYAKQKINTTLYD